MLANSQTFRYCDLLAAVLVLPDSIRGRIFRLAVIVSCLAFYILIDYDTSLFVIMLSGMSRYWTEKVESALPRRNSYSQKDMSCLAVIGDWKYVIFLCHNLCGSPCVQSVLEVKNRFKLSLTATRVITFTECSKVCIRNGHYISH